MLTKIIIICRKYQCFSYWMRNTNKHDWYEGPKLYDVEWMHVVLVLKASNGEFTFYHDGTEQATQVMNRNGNHDVVTGDVIVGSESAVYPPMPSPTVAPTSPPYAGGSMSFDELLMWNRVLSSAEVNQIINLVSE